MNGPLRTIAGLLVLVVLVFGSGCAKSDWIERTLVTVDVTGTWSGRVAAGAGALGGPAGALWFDLKQQGATVKGFLQYQGPGGVGLPMESAPLDGTVTGDVFRFKQRSTGAAAKVS